MPKAKLVLPECDWPMLREGAVKLTRIWSFPSDDEAERLKEGFTRGKDRLKQEQDGQTRHAIGS